MTTATEFSRATNGKSIGNGAFMSRCTNPGHNDSKASCKSWDGPDGKVRLHCFGGCDWHDVRAGAEASGFIEAFTPGKTESPAERQQRQRKQAETRKQREAEELEQSKKAIAAANQIWGGTVHV